MIFYLLQRDIQHYFNEVFMSRYMAFLLARTFRFLGNDAFVILLIYGLFNDRKYVVLAIYVQLAGVLFIFIPYMVIKYFTNYNGPLVSFLHRLIVNPLLLLLLIPAFFYQNKIHKNE